MGNELLIKRLFCPQEFKIDYKKYQNNQKTPRYLTKIYMKKNKS